jgi:hypothetical protein
VTSIGNGRVIEVEMVGGENCVDERSSRNAECVRGGAQAGSLEMARAGMTGLFFPFAIVIVTRSDRDASFRCCQDRGSEVSIQNWLAGGTVRRKKDEKLAGKLGRQGV